MRRHKFDYEAVAGEEYELLKPDLVKVQESLGNFAFANEVKQTSFKDAFFKVSALAAMILPKGRTGQPYKPLLSSIGRRQEEHVLSNARWAGVPKQLRPYWPAPDLLLKKQVFGHHSTSCKACGSSSIAHHVAAQHLLKLAVSSSLPGEGAHACTLKSEHGCCTETFEHHYHQGTSLRVP